MSWPTVSILIMTYDRPKEIRQTINALRKHLKYNGTLLWHIADDGTPEPYLANIRNDYRDLHMTATVTERKGFGANANKAYTFCLSHSDYVFFIEDDRPPIRDIDLNRAVALIESGSDSNKPGAASERKPIGLVRLDGIAGHWFLMELREAKTRLGNMPYFRILRSSPHLNVMSNRPHLMHRRFHDHYNGYPVGKNLGETETIYAHRVKHDSGGPWIACLVDGIMPLQTHIGKSRQLTPLDPNYKPAK